MSQYIDKDALVAEIEKRIKETESMQPKFDQFWAGQISAFKGVLKIINTIEVKEAGEEPVSKDLGEYISELSKQFPEVSFAKLSRIAVRVAKWKEEQMIANTADATIGVSYENKDGGYTHLIDVSRPLPVGRNKIAIIFKED